VTIVSRATTAGHAYLDLKARAKAESRLTDELIQLYVLEGFLARLIASDHAAQLVLKGGVLLAAFGTRRPTRDIDFAALDLDNDAEHVLGVVREIAAQTLKEEDGLVFDGARAAADVIRDEDHYSGVRVSMGVALATARTRFHVDVNVGDSVWPPPNQVEVPRLLGGQSLNVAGYPLPMVHAERIVTAVQRGTVNTRWRDFGDGGLCPGSTQPMEISSRPRSRTSPTTAMPSSLPFANSCRAIPKWPNRSGRRGAASRSSTTCHRSSVTYSRTSSRSPTQRSQERPPT